MKRILISLAILSAMVVSCYYDSEESLYPDLGSCDTLNVTYSGSILPLLENNCLSCHASSVAADKGGDINLQGYANVSDLQFSILSSINHEAGAKAMPKNSGKLKDCLINQFTIWVNAGAPAN